MPPGSAFSVYLSSCDAHHHVGPEAARRARLESFVCEGRASLLGLLGHRRIRVLMDKAEVQRVGLIVGGVGTKLLQRGGQTEDGLRIVGQKIKPLAQVRRCA